MGAWSGLQRTIQTRRKHLRPHSTVGKILLRPPPHEAMERFLHGFTLAGEGQQPKTG